MSWQDYANKSRSTKIALAHMFPRQRWKEWTLVSGATYEATMPFIPTKLHVGQTELTETSFPMPGINRWAFIPGENKVRINTGVHPKTQNVIITYKICLSSAPVILPHDLDTGYDVDYEPLIKDLSDVKLELDYENAGIALETNSSITLENTGRFFDPIFDTLIWENQRCVFYSYGQELDPAESRIVFDGFIESKNFSPRDVKFNLKDQFKRLRDKLSMPNFSALDGVFEDEFLDRPKRRIYGRVKNIRTLGVDKVLEGFQGTGTITGSFDSDVITGTGTQFLRELSPNDEIVFFLDTEEFKYKIQAVNSDTSIQLSQPLDVPANGLVFEVKPSRPYRFKNRNWHVAGHTLKSITTTVNSLVSPTRLQLASVADIEVGDRALYNGNEYCNVIRITGDVVVLDRAVGVVPVGGESFEIVPIRDVFFGAERLIEGRDYTFTNGPTDAIIHLDELAEFNITRQFKSAGTFQFTNGSRDVTCSTANLDLNTILSARDWIKPDGLTFSTWYEILEVQQSSLKLRSVFTDPNYTGSVARKNVNLVDDDSLITVDCTGLADAGLWVKNASQVIKHVLENDLTGGVINDQAFDQAEEDAPQLISAYYPKTIGNEAPVIRDVITEINRSVFGALYQDKNFKYTFSVLQSDKSEDIPEIAEDDIISYTGATKTNIANLIRVNYRPFVDVNSGSEAFSLVEYENSFVDDLSQIKNTLEVTAYLYRESDANIYAHRLAFLRSVTNSTISIKGKLSLQSSGLGDKVLLLLDRLYDRYGGEDNSKVALVYGVQADEANTTLSVNDFNGMFTRVPAIAPDTANDYAGASVAEIAKYGYIVDNDTETPDAVSNKSLGNNLIG